MTFRREIMEQHKEFEISSFIGKHLIYTYANGWQYEMYVKNEKTIDYRIHSGLVGGRWVRDQHVYIARLGSNIYKVSWDEPTGTAVSVAFNLDERKVHGTIFFPRWIDLSPEKTICFQNDHLNTMKKYRDYGPTYPKRIVDEFARINFVEQCEINDESIVSCPPSELPDGYAERAN